MTIAPPDHEEPHAGTAILARLLRAERPRTSLVDHMVEDIAQQIILGRLSPGADLNSVDLACHYGSSRTPVREALLTLQREGLVEIHAHHRSLAAPGRLDRSLADHERLLTAYAERDAPLAVAIARSIAYAGYHAVEADADLRSVPLSARTADGL